MAEQKEGGVCELCERKVGRLTGHHLVPKARGGKHGPQVLLCPTCHRQLHALFSEATLEKDLSTVEALKQHPQVASFLSWMRKQKRPASFGCVVQRGGCEQLPAVFPGTGWDLKPS